MNSQEEEWIFRISQKIYVDILKAIWVVRNKLQINIKLSHVYDRFHMELTRFC